MERGVHYQLYIAHNRGRYNEGHRPMQGGHSGAIGLRKAFDPLVAFFQQAVERIRVFSMAEAGQRAAVKAAPSLQEFCRIGGASGWAMTAGRGYGMSFPTWRGSKHARHF